MKTNAVVFPSANCFEVRELTLPKPGPDDMVVRTLVSAVSPGTERWILRGLHLGTRFPCVPGYHRVGIVESCGENCIAFKPGDVVYGCGNRWDEDIVSMWGAHVGMSVSPAGGYHLISQDLLPMEKLEAVAFSVLCGVSNRGINKVDTQPGEKTLHIGAGIVGACAAQLAQMRGAEPVLLDKDPERIAYIKANLPDIPIFSVDEENLAEKLKAVAPAGFDMVQDTVGHAPTVDAMVQLMKGQGTLLLQAQYFDKEKCAIDLDQIKVRELVVKTTCGTRQEDWEQTSANLLSGALNMQALITHRMKSDCILDAYEMLHTGKPHNIGMIIDWT